MKPIKEKKHNHILTDYLKVLIFSILMLLPFFSIATRSLYVICNKNAYQSYYGETINNINVISLTSLNIGNEVYFTNTNNINSTTESGQVTNNYINYTDIEIIDNGTMTESMRNFVLTSIKIGFYKVAGNNYYSIFFYDSDNNNNSYSSTITFTIKFVVTGFEYKTLTPFELYNQSPFTIRSYNNYSYLDNVFEYSIDKLENDNYISWTKNTALYNGIKTMTNSLGMETNTIAVLITYWFFLIIIYVIIDIILHMFVWLTHMIGKA